MAEWCRFALRRRYGPRTPWLRARTMRQRAKDPEVTAWWAESDALTLGRERRYMLPGEVVE